MTSAFDQHARLYEQHSTRLFYAMRKETGNTELAEDIVQETFVRLLRFYPIIPDISRVRSLLNVIAKRALLDEYRRQQTRIQPVALIEECFDLPADLTEDPQEGCADMAFTEHILAQLSPKYHTIIAMLIEHYSYAEIAARVGTTPTNVKMMIHRAREAAWEQYQREMEGEAA